MLRCKEVVRKLASDELADSSWSQRLAVRIHLLMCRHCWRYARQLGAMGAAARNLYGKNLQGSTDLEQLEDRVFSAATAEAEDAKAGSASTRKPADPE